MEDKIKFAYTAGIIDGEGTITLTKIRAKNPFRYPVISVSSTTYSILEYLKSNFGGVITPVKNNNPNHKQAWHWNLIGNKVLLLLPNIIPYMLEPLKIYRGNLIVNNYNKLTPRNGKYTDDMKQAKFDFEYKFFHPSDTMD